MTRVLILDDRPINRQYLTTLLAYRGFETREASDGLEGLHVAEEWHPDLAIVDISMPLMDGVEFARRLRAGNGQKATPVIFYTATYDIRMADRIARECGVEHVLMKPSEPEQIFATIELVLGPSGTPHRAPPVDPAEFARLHADAMRTSALIDFQLEIAAQRRPEDILSILSRTAPNIITSGSAVVTLADGASALHCREHLRQLLAEARVVRTTQRADCAECAVRNTGVNSYLGVPIVTLKQCYAWLSLVNREGGPFTLEDERIAMTLAAQTAIAYENLLLYDRMRKDLGLLRATIEARGDGILVIGRDGRHITHNERFVELWQVPAAILESGNAEDSLQHALTMVKDPDALHSASEGVRDGKEVSVTCEMIDGRFVECHATPPRFGGDEISRVWSFRDVTDRMRAEEALRSSEEQYRSLIANIPDVVWTADDHGTVTFISPNVETLYGFTSEEVIANGEALWRDRVHPDDRALILQAYADLFAGRGAFDCEYRLQRKDGSWMWVHGWSVQTYQHDGVHYADGVVHDITARKAAEDELRRVARERELLLESTGEGIYAVDNDGRCTMANRVGASLLGRTIEEMIGNPIHPLVHQHNGSACAECALDLAFRAQSPSRVTDDSFARQDGSLFPVEYVSAPIIDEGVVRGSVVTFSDVTERRRLERRVEQASRVDSLGRMAATIAHEFNNVLMGIQPFAEVIRKRAGADSPLAQLATQIINAVNRGKTITQDILGMTRTAEPALRSIDVTGWLRQIAAEIHTLLGDGIVINVLVPPPATLHARFDPAQMQQVLTNLALNARDAMGRRGTLTLMASEFAPFVRFTIADTGSGIAADALPFIFEPLFTTKHSGTGLGLAVAQQLVVRGGGVISVESDADGGTRFHIDLPQSTVIEPAPPDHPVEESNRLGIRRVLVVEDDSHVAAGLSELLVAEDVDVRVVTLGREAMKMASSFHPEVVVIDISLPDMSGVAVYEEVIAAWPDIGVIFSTGHADAGLLPPSGRARVGFLRKPYSSETLIRMLRKVS